MGSRQRKRGSPGGAKLNRDGLECSAAPRLDPTILILYHGSRRGLQIFRRSAAETDSREL